MVDSQKMKKVEQEPLGTADFKPEAFRLPQKEKAPLPVPEKPQLESGDNLESSRLSNQSEMVQAGELIQRHALPPTASLYEEDYRRIEKVLEENLSDFYFRLSPLEQQKFKQKGEETTVAILRIISKPRFKIRRIVELIKNWLKLLPGINRFFLEQTAKIKADKIIVEVTRKRPYF